LLFSYKKLKIMEEKKKNLITLEIIYICLLGIMLGLIISSIIINPKKFKAKNFDKGYKQGQIDALNGIQNYDKAVRKDTIYFKIK